MKTEHIALLSPSPGTTRSLTVYRFGEIGARPKVYLQAGLHADEWPGILVLQHLIPMLEQAEQAGQIHGEIVVVPFANPVGMGQNIFGYNTGRFDLAGTGNFNRNFGDLNASVSLQVEGKLGFDEAHNTSTIRTALKQAVHELPSFTEADELKNQLLALSIDSDYVFDLHCDDASSAHLYAVSEQREAAKTLCQALEFNYLFLEELEGAPAFDGTHLQAWHALREAHPEFPVTMPTLSVTLEYRGQHDVNDKLAEPDARKLFAYFAAQNIIQIDDHTGQSAFSISEPSEFPVFTTQLDSVDTIKVNCTGILVYKKGLEDEVEEGELFAEVIQLEHLPPNNRIAIVANTNGKLMAVTPKAFVKPGDLIAKIAGEKPLTYRTKGNLLQL
jgi:predicted deacylase